MLFLSSRASGYFPFGSRWENRFTNNDDPSYRSSDVPETYETRGRSSQISLKIAFSPVGLTTIGFLVPDPADRIEHNLHLPCDHINVSAPHPLHIFFLRFINFILYVFVIKPFRYYHINRIHVTFQL